MSSAVCLSLIVPSWLARREAWQILGHMATYLLSTWNRHSFASALVRNCDAKPSSWCVSVCHTGYHILEILQTILYKSAHYVCIIIIYGLPSILASQVESKVSEDLSSNTNPLFLISSDLWRNESTGLIQFWPTGSNSKFVFSSSWGLARYEAFGQVKPIKATWLKPRTKILF